jgi:hypothetical protein
MYEYVFMTLDIAQLIAISVCVFFIWALRQEADFDPQDIITSLQKADAGVASGTAKQKKNIDKIFGEAILSQSPILTAVCNKWPELGDYLKRYPNMAPYATQLANQAMGMGVDKLPPQFQELLQSVLGGTKNPTSTEKTEKMPWE